MTREEFIEILDREGYPYKIVNDKIVITSRSRRGINLVGSAIDDTVNGGQMIIIIDEIPSGIIFQGKGGVNLSSLEVLPPDVEFRNIGKVDLSSMKLPIDLADSFNNSGGISFSNLYWKGNWEGNIEGIDNKRLFRLMIKRGIFK
jgi:hypothetical protein